MPFLTELDERAEVKGSRDPLGLVPVWSKFGRKVVGNLTTGTGAVRGFTTLLVGLEIADMLREQLRNDAPTQIDTFLKFEQLAGYARLKCQKDKEIRGYRRILRRLNEGRRIRISADSAAQILSNQKTYGLWGLFTAPARSSGLLLTGEPRLTTEARSFVHRNYFSMLDGGRGVKSLLALLRKDSFDLQPYGRDTALLDSIGKIHSRHLRAEERTFYRDHIAWGGADDSTRGQQRELAEILTGIETKEFGFREFRAVQKKARKTEALALSLEKIGTLERLIAPAALIFGFLQDRDGQTLQSIVKQIAETWNRPLRLDVQGIRELQPEISNALSREESELWMQLAETLSSGDYGSAVELLIRINASVMQRRQGAAAWIGIEASRIRVRLSDERVELTSVHDAEDRWRSTYFINSLWRIAREVGV